jgi:hypothetical protein
MKKITLLLSLFLLLALVWNKLKTYWALEITIKPLTMLYLICAIKDKKGKQDYVYF